MKIPRTIPTPVFLILCVVSFFVGEDVALRATRKGIQWQFCEAARRGDVGSLKRLYSEGAEIDKQPSDASGNQWGSSALMEAAGAGNAEAAQWLLDHGADPKQEEALATPLDFAKGRIHSAQRTVEILQKHGAKRYQDLHEPDAPAP